MAREPWKRAAQLSRARQGKIPAKQTGGMHLQRHRPSLPRIIGLVLLALIIVGGAGLWFFRGWWIPRYRDSLPDVVAQGLREPQVYPDFMALELGMDAKLIVFGDYLDLIKATRDWHTDWEIKQTGPTTLFLEADGLSVNVLNGQIETYMLDLDRIFAEEKWQGWLPSWREANLTPDLTYTALTGEQDAPPGLAEYTYTSKTSVKHGGSWVKPEWVLHFHNGWLKRIESRYQIGAGIDQ